MAVIWIRTGIKVLRLCSRQSRQRCRIVTPSSMRLGQVGLQRLTGKTNFRPLGQRKRLQDTHRQRGSCSIQVPILRLMVLRVVRPIAISNCCSCRLIRDVIEESTLPVPMAGLAFNLMIPDRAWRCIIVLIVLIVLMGMTRHLEGLKETVFLEKATQAPSFGAYILVSCLVTMP